MKRDDLKEKIASIQKQLPKRWSVLTEMRVNGHYFPHIIIDNFFEEDEFEKIKTYKAEVEPDAVNISHNEVSEDGTIKSDRVDAEFLEGIHHKYTPHLREILGVLAPRKLQAYEYSDFHLITSGKNYKHPVHDDVPRKLLSVVVYISPEKNNGTFIHKGKYKMTPVGEVEWKPNRAMIFSRRDRKSWHSYSGDTINDRLCVIYNLNTYKAYKAFKAERNIIKYLKKRLRDK